MISRNHIPTIPLSLIRRSYNSSDGSLSEGKSKDVNRSPNVTALLDSYINNFNSNPKIESDQKLIPFTDSFDNKERNKNARNIIKNEMQKHLLPEWIDGTQTFNQTYQMHKLDFEVCVGEICKVPQMKVYTQATSNWAIKKLMEDVITNKRKNVQKNSRVKNEPKFSNTEKFPPNSSTQAHYSPQQLQIHPAHGVTTRAIPSYATSVKCNSYLDINASKPAHQLPNIASCNEYSGINRNFSLDDFKKAVYKADMKQILEDYISNETFWDEVEEICNRKSGNMLTKNQLDVVRQSLVERLSFIQDSPIVNNSPSFNSNNDLGKKLWLQFKELEASLLAVCHEKPNYSGEQSQNGKSKKRSLPVVTSKPDGSGSDANVVSRKSRRVVWPSQKMKEQNDLKNKRS